MWTKKLYIILYITFSFVLGPNYFQRVSFLPIPNCMVGLLYGTKLFLKLHFLFLCNQRYFSNLHTVLSAAKKPIGNSPRTHLWQAFQKNTKPLVLSAINWPSVYCAQYYYEKCNFRTFLSPTALNHHINLVWYYEDIQMKQTNKDQFDFRKYWSS